MRISHEYKFIYISIPKTGSTTIRKMLQKYKTIDSSKLDGAYEHMTAKELKQIFEKRGWNWDEYYKFTTVRNPWARQWSYHNYQLKVASHPEIYEKKYNNYFKLCVEYSKNFYNFKKAIVNKNFHCPQSKYILENDSDKQSILVDSFCKLENIRDDLISVWKKIGLKIKDLNSIPNENKSTEINYKQAYDEESKYIIKSFYLSDVEIFNYSFSN